MVASKKVYEPPLIEEWTIAGLTQVGLTNPGSDLLTVNGRIVQEDGSVCPPNNRNVTCR